MWIYKENPLTEELYNHYLNEGFIGFVYIIENLKNDKKYIGKKLWITKQKLPPLKGKKRKRIRTVSTDWRNYYGSSEELLRDVEHYGKQAFRRTILHLCRSKGEASYLEAYEQFNRNVLLREDYYNTWISCRIRTSHLKHLRETYSSQSQDLFSN